MVNKLIADLERIAKVDYVGDEFDEAAAADNVRSVVDEENVTTEINKAGPPGPPPRPGLVWWEPTHRWRDPDTGHEEKHTGPYFTPPEQQPFPGMEDVGITEEGYEPPMPVKIKEVLEADVSMKFDFELRAYIDDIGDQLEWVQNREQSEYWDEVYDNLTEKMNEAVDHWATEEYESFNTVLENIGIYSELQDLYNEVDTHYYFDPHGSAYLEDAADMMESKAKSDIENAYEYATDDSSEGVIDDIIMELDLEGAHELGLDDRDTKYMQKEISDYVKHDVESTGQGDRGDVKNHLVTRLQSKLLDSFLPSRGNNPIIQKQVESFWINLHEGALPSSDSDISKRTYEVIDSLVHTWASTSADNHDTALAMQQAAVAAFGLGNAETVHLNTTEKSEELFNKYGGLFSKFHKAQYEHTQDWLKERNISEVTIYRGAGLENSKIPGYKGGVGTVWLQPISSVSLNPTTAGGFAGHGSKGTPTVSIFKIPAEKILSTCVSGYGCLNEQELTILGGGYDGIIVNVEGMESDDAAGELIERIYSQIEQQKVAGTYAKSLSLIIFEKSKGSHISLDADPFNADWPKRTWDFPHINSKMELITHLKMMGISWAAFQRLPVYQMNVGRLPWLSQDVQKTYLAGPIIESDEDKTTFGEESEDSVLPLSKGPPGPPPRPGLVWWEPTHRWRDPETGEEQEHSGEMEAARNVLPKLNFDQLANYMDAMDSEGKRLPEKVLEYEYLRDLAEKIYLEKIGEYYAKMEVVHKDDVNLLINDIRYLEDQIKGLKSTDKEFGLKFSSKVMLGFNLERLKRLRKKLKEVEIKQMAVFNPLIEMADKLGISKKEADHLDRAMGSEETERPRHAGLDERGDAKAELTRNIAAILFKQSNGNAELAYQLREFVGGDSRLGLAGINNDDVYNVVNSLVHTWSESSADNNPTALAMQIAAWDEFQTINGRMSHLTGKKNYEVAKQLYDKTGILYKAFHRAQYSETQKWLEGKGVGEYVTLYRGAKLPREDFPVGTSGITTLKLQPVSSFSTNIREAANFAYHGESGIPSVSAVRIPRQKVLSTSRTGYGCLHESEITVLGDEYESLLINLDDLGFTSLQIEEHIVGMEERFAKAVGMVYLDDLDKNADWPKRTDDTMFGPGNNISKAIVDTPMGDDGVNFDQVGSGDSVWITVTDPSSPLHGRPVLLTKRPDGLMAITGGAGPDIDARRHYVLTGKPRRTRRDEEIDEEVKEAEAYNAPLEAASRELRVGARRELQGATDSMSRALGIKTLDKATLAENKDAIREYIGGIVDDEAEADRITNTISIVLQILSLGPLHLASAKLESVPREKDKLL